METRLFFKRFLSLPGQVGSFVPSSRRLAAAMVAEMRPDPGRPLIELGPGTGVFTKALLAAGMPAERLLLIELDATFAAHLRATFPDVRVIEADVAELPRIIAKEGLGPVAQMRSGLPFRSMPPDVRRRVGQAVAHSLADGGRLVQFSYFPIPPLPPQVAEEHGLASNISRFVAANLPPAFIWHYEKTAPAT